MFHETKENKMFKKTLLALSVASVASVAGAANIATNDTVNGFIGVVPVTNALADVRITGTVGAGTNCALAATSIQANLQNTGNGEGAGNTLTGTTRLGIADVDAVVMTGAGICDVTTVEALITAPTVVGLEAAQVGAAQLQGNIIAGIGGYEDESTITIQITGANVDLSKTVAPSLTVTDAATDNSGGAIAGLVSIPVLDITGSQVRFTVPVGVNIDPRAIVSIADVFIDANGITGATEVFLESFATNTAGIPYDPAAITKVMELKKQYTASVTRQLDGVIDVTEERQSLVAQTAVAPAPLDLLDNDLLEITLKHEVNNGVGTELAGISATYTVTSINTDVTIPAGALTGVEKVGGFGWMDTDGDGTVSAGEIAANVTITPDGNSSTDSTTQDAASTATLDSTNTYLTYTITADGAATPVNQSLDLVHTLNFDTAALHLAGATNTLSPVIEPQQFAVNASVTSNVFIPTTTTLKTLTACLAAVSPENCNLDAGEWTLNGSVLVVPYMPFGADVGVILRHTNTGVQDGDITIRYMLEGVDTAWNKVVGSVKTTVGGVMNITAEVMAAIKADIAAEGVGDATKGKVAIEITTEAPEKDITVYAAYKVKSEEDRGFVGTFGEHGSADQN